MTLWKLFPFNDAVFREMTIRSTNLASVVATIISNTALTSTGGITSILNFTTLHWGRGSEKRNEKRSGMNRGRGTERRSDTNREKALMEVHLQNKAVVSLCLFEHWPKLKVCLVMRQEIRERESERGLWPRFKLGSALREPLHCAGCGLFICICWKWKVIPYKNNLGHYSFWSLYLSLHCTYTPYCEAGDILCLTLKLL